MTIKAVILYGSRARNDSFPTSDTDILGVADDGPIQRTYNSAGVSFHIYPMPWLIKQSSQGSLFLLHLVCEGVEMFDPERLLDQIKSEFSYKPNYTEDAEVGLRVLFAVMHLDQGEFDDRLRTRYFWGLRTVLMATAADQKQPTFASASLEALFGIDGLTNHIRGRSSSSFEECRFFGSQIISRMGSSFNSLGVTDDPQQNLRFLLRFGGIGAETAANIVYHL